jgi:TetR/AcrR family transcriptional regulator, transcriptional repressor for nem operon
MTSTSSRGRTGTAERTLDVAERLVQVRGFNGFSYADVARELGITTATLHYHFPGKAELGAALIERYAARFTDALAGIDRDITDARAKLEAYAGIYAKVLRAKRMCLCGILAAEYETLPQPMREAVTRFFADNEAWLATVLVQGERDGTLSIHGSPADAAQMILSGLEGAMLVARTSGGVSRFQSSANRLLAALAH